MTAHVMGPFIGTDSLGWRSTCSCSHEVAGASKDELRQAYQRHAGALATKPGVAKARQALAESLERGKPVPVDDDLHGRCPCGGVLDGRGVCQDRCARESWDVPA